MAYKDLREWIKRLEEEKELARVKVEVDWNLEIGGIVQENFDRKGPALLFENIKDYKNTFCKKLFTASLSTYSRVALMLGVPKNTPYKELIKVWRERMKKPIKPVIVNSGPCKENIMKGDEVNLFQFPVPKWHRFDGGRYIGTFHGVVTKDPETDWVNVGMYRQMIHDNKTTSITVPIGQHIWLHWRSYRKRGEPLPMAVVIGWDPILTAVACAPVPAGLDEYDVMGALRGEPVELVRCETVDLYVPASCEIVLEGEVPTDLSTFRKDGPFGEYTGYYGTGRSAPVFNVKCITFRDDPIFQGTLEGVPVNEDHTICSVNHSAAIWNLLEERMTGVMGVNCDPSTAWANLIVKINNSYYGQVHQVAANIWSSNFSTMIGKNIIVCDEDIDIYDLGKVFWAIAYRVNPRRDIILFPGWISALDPVVHPSERTVRAVNKGWRVLIDATKKIDWPRTDEWFGQKFPPLAYPDDKTMDLVRKNWEKYGIE